MPELRRSLGVLNGTAMMLNIVLGAGLLTLPGLARIATGDAALLVWIACALAALPLLTVFAILGRRHPDAGGLAAMLDHAFGAHGRIPATFLFLGAVSVGLPAIALTGGHYASVIAGGSPAAYAVALILAAFATNFLPTTAAARVNAGVASVILVFLLALAGLGWAAVRPDAAGILTRAVATGLPDPQVFGAAFMMVFFAFTGWEVAANLGGEFRDARRSLPWAMGLSFAIAVALYLVLALVAAGSPAGLSPAPFAEIIGVSHGPIGATAVAAMAVVLIYANLSSAVWAVSRMVYSAARDGLLPGQFAMLNRERPISAVILTGTVLLGVVAAAGLNLLQLEGLLAIAGQNFLLLYAASAIALLRLGEEAWHRGLAFLSLALVLAMMASRSGSDYLYPAILTGAGLVLASSRHRFRSKGSG